LIFCFYLLKSISSKKQKSNVLYLGRTKSVIHFTEKNTEGLASGRAKKTERVLINTFKINPISFIKTAGFFDLGVCA